MTNDAVDRIIETTLANDAERIRSQFASTPSAGLAAKLAGTGVSKGLLAALSAKLLLVAGAALLAGATVYLWPVLRSHSSGAATPTALEHPSTAAPPVQEAIHTQSSTTLAPADFSQAPKISAKRPNNWLHLDDGGGKNTKTITSRHYEPPLK